METAGVLKNFWWFLVGLEFWQMIIALAVIAGAAFIIYKTLKRFMVYLAIAAAIIVLTAGIYRYTPDAKAKMKHQSRSSTVNLW